MSKRQSHFSWGLLATGLAVALSWSMASGQNRAEQTAEQLVPKNTVLFVGCEGSGQFVEQWEKTAAYDAMIASGLQGVFEKFFKSLGQQAGADDNPQAQAFQKVLADLDQHGAVIAVSLPSQPGPPLPQVTVVLRNGAQHAAALTTALSLAGGFAGLAPEPSEVNGRSVISTVIPDSPGIEVGAWAEGKHFVIAAGIDAVAASIAVASGDAPSLAENPTWRKYRGDGDRFNPRNVAWLDFAKLRQTFGPMPLPLPNPEADGTVNGVLKVLGLHNLDNVAYQYGYKGRSLWTEITIATSGPRTGLLALTDAKPITLDDLPPLPVGITAMHASSCNPVGIWDALTGVVRAGSAFGPPGVSDQVNGVLDNLPQIAGFDPKADLLEALGDVMCIYSDSNQGLLGTGIAVVVRVKDAGKLSATFDQIFEIAGQASRGDFRVTRSEKLGRQLIQFNIEDKAQFGALVIDDDWMILSLMPQAAEAFLARIDGKLPAWKPTADLTAALDEMPDKFTSLTIGDPRDSWGVAMKAAPLLVNVGLTALNQARVLPPGIEVALNVADIPAAELVTAPLYPNVTVQTVDDNGVHITVRQSLPGFPVLSGLGEGGGMGAVATTGVLVALLLPAVQQAREAARRTQSKNNLKQLGLALHNYADTYQNLPSGTHPNADLEPEQRLSWLASVLPFLDQQALWKTIDFDAAWNADQNKLAGSVAIATLRNPGTPGTGHNETHYVGIAGVGVDAPTLPVNHKRAGFFGYDRQTRFRDIVDGTSNTVAVSEASHSFGPWAQGGNSTLRALTQKPYINGPDGIGGPSKGGCNILLGDGSVRFVSENIDPAVMEALSTIAGGEAIPGGF